MQWVLNEFHPPIAEVSYARQTANQTWQLFTLTGWDERMRVYHSGAFSPKRMKQRQTKQEKACKYSDSGLFQMLLWFLAVMLTCRQTLDWCVSVCRAAAETQTHRSSAAAQPFDVQGAGSVVHVCPLSTRSKTWKQRQSTYWKSVTQHIWKFSVVGWFLSHDPLHSGKIQDRLIFNGCYRGWEGFCQ